MYVCMCARARVCARVNAFIMIHVLHVTEESSREIMAYIHVCIIHTCEACTCTCIL